MASKKKTTKKKFLGRMKPRETESESAPPSEAAEKASAKAKPKDGRPEGAPPADQVLAEWETDTHYFYKIKPAQKGDGNRKIKIAK